MHNIRKKDSSRFTRSKIEQQPSVRVTFSLTAGCRASSSPLTTDAGSIRCGRTGRRQTCPESTRQAGMGSTQEDLTVIPRISVELGRLSFRDVHERALQALIERLTVENRTLKSVIRSARQGVYPVHTNRMIGSDAQGCPVRQKNRPMPGVSAGPSSSFDRLS